MGIIINMDETPFKEIVEILQAYEMDLNDREIISENPKMLDLTESDDQSRLHIFEEYMRPLVNMLDKQLKEVVKKHGKSFVHDLGLYKNKEDSKGKTSAMNVRGLDISSLNVQIS